MTERQMQAVEVRVVVAPDGKPNVLLQLPTGYLILHPGDARDLACMLTETAEDAEGLAT